MAGHGNYPLNQSHYDEVTLQEYVLGQLLPDQEEEIREHLISCPACRAEVTEIQHFCQRLTSELNHRLDRAHPKSPLSFDDIAGNWRKPPRRVTWQFRLQQVIPGTTSIVLLALLALASLLFLSSSDSTALRSLELTEDYHGPAVMVAAATNDGLVILQLSDSDTRVMHYLSAVIDPRNLQFSPDGRWLALRDGLTLHVIETRKSGAHLRLPVTDAADWSWSPDSTLLAYTDGRGQLAVLDTTLKATQVLIPADEYAWGMPVWTQDSQQIAYATAFPLPNSGITVLQQGLWRVQLASAYRVQVADNPDAAHTLLVPAAWVNVDAALLAWDASAGPAGHLTTLYRIDTRTHGLDHLEDRSLAQGTRLIWPVNDQGITLVTRHERLVSLNLGDKTRQYLLNPVPWPQTLAWSPNGAWMAYTVSGAAEGEGLYLFATEEGELRSMHLPAGATEKSVSWAGAEHLFVFRQRQDGAATELWLVSVTTGEIPQRIMTNVRIPDAASGSGWQWNDVLATQIIPAGS